METNKSKNLVLIVLFIILIINISMMITFFIFPREKPIKDWRAKDSYHKENMRCLMNEMNLTEEQEIRFFEYRDAHRANIETLFDSVKIVRNQMIDAIIQDASADELKLFAEHMGNLEKTIQMETIEYFLKMRELLNKEQFGKLIDNFRDVCGCPHFNKGKRKGGAKQHEGCLHKEINK